MKINVILDVDEKIVLEESGQPTLTEAIGQELGWLRDSGMFVDRWSYLEQEKERGTPAEDPPQAYSNSYYVETDNGREILSHGFISASNFKKYPDRVCYVPENWDFEEDGPGITGQDIIDLCDGDKLKAQMVFELCDWQHPSTVLGEWDHDDDVALEELRDKQRHTVSQPAFTDVLNSAIDCASSQQNLPKVPEPHR